MIDPRLRRFSIPSSVLLERDCGYFPAHMSWRTLLRPFVPIAVLGAVALVVRDPRELARSGGSRLHLSIATGGTGGVWYPYGGGLARLIGRHVRNTDATAEVTAASVDNLRFLGNGTADIAFTMADALADAANARAPFERDGRIPARAIAAIYTNYLHLIARSGRGISRVADLRGRFVATGAPGSGIETIALRMFETAGLRPGRDVTTYGLSASQSVDAFRDGKIDAFFWMGGLPTGSILDLMSTDAARVTFVATDDMVDRLNSRYGPTYFRAVIPANTYPRLDRSIPTLGVANVLVVHRAMSDPLAYEITRAIFEHRDELVAVHPEARHLDPARAARGLPVPLHPGASRYYREIGVTP